MLRCYREFTSDAPDELACDALLVRVPPEDPFPEQHRGEPAVALAVASAGPIPAAEEALAPLREFGDPIVDGIAPMPYATLQRAFDDGSPEGYRWYTKSHYLDRDEDDRVRAAYGENYDRLEAVKAEWDPENLFSTNQNVEPTD